MANNSEVRKHASSYIDAVKQHNARLSEHPAPKKPAKPKYAKLSLKPNEALTLLRFLNTIKTTREDWHELDAIHSKLYKAYQKV